MLEYTSLFSDWVIFSAGYYLIRCTQNLHIIQLNQCFLCNIFKHVAVCLNIILRKNVHLNFLILGADIFLFLYCVYSVSLGCCNFSLHVKFGIFRDVAKKNIFVFIVLLDTFHYFLIFYYLFFL